MIETVRHSTAGDPVEWDGVERRMSGTRPAPMARQGGVSPWRRPDRMRGAVLVATLSTVGATWLLAVAAFIAGHLHIAMHWH